MTARSARTWAWAVLGFGSGLLAVGLVYAGHLVVSGRADPGVLLELHRQWPAFLLLDAMPFLLAWIGWLAGELRATEAALVETRAALGPLGDPALASAVLDPVLVVDAHARIVAANPAASALLEAENLVGTALREVLPDLERTDLGSSERLTRSGRLVGVLWQTAARRADGSTVAVNVSCGPAAGNRVVYVLGSEGPARAGGRDVEERLVRERDLARVDARMKSLFLAGFVGELRARLDPVAGIAAGRDHELRVPVRRATALVAAVTDLCRIEAGRLALLVDVVPVEPVLGWIVRTQQPLAALRGSSLTGAPAGDLLVRADGVRLEEVLIALVENACRATKAGRIEVRATREQDPRWVRIDVSDTGIGMDPDHVAHLFDRGMSVDVGARPRFGGVSLSQARKLVERMDGTLTITSTFGSGTTASVRLGAAEGAIRPPSGVEERRPVVIVDRQPESVRTLLRDHLARAGIDPVLWLTGEPQELRALDPWAVAIDLDVGEQLLAEVLADPSFAGIPIVAATSTVHDRARTLPDGVSALIDAPFDHRELVPALIRADRAVRGCAVLGAGEGAETIRRALALAGFSVRMNPAQPDGVAVWVDSAPPTQAPNLLAVRSDQPQAAVDRVCFATTRRPPPS